MLRLGSKSVSFMLSSGFLSPEVFLWVLCKCVSEVILKEDEPRVHVVFRDSGG